MLRVRLLETTPPNLDEFVREIAAALEDLYGPAAAHNYRLRGRSILMSTLLHPAVSAWGAFDGSLLVGLLFTVLRPPVGELAFLHVLRPYCGQNAEDRLVEQAVGALRNGGVQGITSDFVPVSALEHHETMLRLGFQHIPRQLMRRALTAPSPRLERPLSRPLTPADWQAAADCLVSAYATHAGRWLHAEVRTPENAADFLRRVADGAYGGLREDYQRGHFTAGACEGLALGCEAAVGTGFVLQLAVRPEARGHGIGGILLEELLAAFARTGLANAALGVSKDNPARQLYSRTGFAAFRDIDAYAWWHSNPKESRE